ncbi:MAG: NAD(P)/FAD-dependent oxidoreductase [Bacteroidetes bacterium]|nr:NAD(P)/FAD-dependent oxidoreductase [Bacteroidota bacterium]
MDKFEIIVVGAGAAGLLAAGTAANRGTKVLLLEKMFRPGRKLRITGKGRCNLTNLTRIDDFLSHVNNPDFLRPAFEQFFAQELIDFFHSIQIKTKTERGRRVFPQSDKAQDIVDGLHLWVNKSGVMLKKDVRVNKLFVKEGKISGVRLNNGKLYFADKIILCTGGASYPATGSTGDGYKLSKTLGHTITNTRPALVPIAVKNDLSNELDRLLLKNVNVKVFRRNEILSEKFGDMQFLKQSISGPIILSLSRELGKELHLGEHLEFALDLKPALSELKLTNRFQREVGKNKRLDVTGLLRKLLPQEMVATFISRLKFDSLKLADQLSNDEIKSIILLLKDFRLLASGLKDFDEAIITSGGVSLDEVNPETMESKKIKNLYFAGELLDLDADTGGYNLQIAFSTGRLAAMAATKKS